jgi:hypothetical protein
MAKSPAPNAHIAEIAALARGIGIFLFFKIYPSVCNLIILCYFCRDLTLCAMAKNVSKKNIFFCGLQ